MAEKRDQINDCMEAEIMGKMWEKDSIYSMPPLEKTVRKESGRQMHPVEETKRIGVKGSRSREKLRLKKQVLLSVTCVILFACFLRAFSLDVPDSNLQPDDETGNQHSGVIKEKEPENTPQKPSNQPETPKAQKTVPCAADEVIIVGREDKYQMVFKGNTPDMVELKGSFQASAEDAAEVAGELALVNPPDQFKKSGKYEWKFTPDDTESYETVTGSAFLTVMREKWVDGMDAVLAIEDKASLYQVSLRDCGLKDLSILEGAVNLVSLDLSDNDIRDISALINCEYLEQIFLTGNKNYKDSGIFLEFKNLKCVRVDGTMISKEEQDRLEGNGIQVLKTSAGSKQY